MGVERDRPQPCQGLEDHCQGPDLVGSQTRWGNGGCFAHPQCSSAGSASCREEQRAGIPIARDVQVGEGALSPLVDGQGHSDLSCMWSSPPGPELCKSLTVGGQLWMRAELLPALPLPPVPPTPARDVSHSASSSAVCGQGREKRESWLPCQPRDCSGAHGRGSIPDLVRALPNLTLWGASEAVLT